MNNSSANSKKRKVTLARHAGFCYGVKRAVETTKKIKLENLDSQVSVLGELIHNSHVISELENLGIKTIHKIPSNAVGTCIIRSHGESFEVFEKVKKSGFELVDLTCLDVKKVQQKAIELAKNDYFLIILGKEEHPEVKAISTDAIQFLEDKNSICIANRIEDLKLFEDKIKSAKKVGVVLQTTQTFEYLMSVVDYLSKICKVLRIQNTICPSTSLRQNEAKKLAQESDLMFVVGSKKSANTTHLAQIIQDITKVVHIEEKIELNNYIDLIKNSQSIGITAGASTPDNVINEVIEYIENIN